jgi:outer membrane protein
MKKWELISLCWLLSYASGSYGQDLFSIYQQALTADPKVQTAQLQMQVVNAQKGQALGDMLPQVSGSANWSLNAQRREVQVRTGTGHTNDSYSGTRYTISLNQTLIDFAKFWTWRRTQKVEDQASAESTDAVNKLMFDVVDRYFSVLDAEDQLYFIKTEKQAMQKKLEQARKQYAKQLLKVTDLYEVEARLDKIEADEIEVEKNLAVAREGLSELTGQQPYQLKKLSSSILYRPLEGKIDNWIDVAKSQNPLLLAQVKGIEAANDNVSIQQARNLPVVDLQLNYYSTNTGYQSSNIGNTEVQVAAINVNVPLFSGGASVERMNEAKHRLIISRYDHEAKIRAIEKETRDAYLTTNANYKRIHAAEKAISSAEKSYEAMEKGLNYGVETMADVLTAQQNVFRVKRELSQVKYGYIKNRIRFLYATGMISEDNLKEVNRWLEK